VENRWLVIASWRGSRGCALFFALTELEGEHCDFLLGNKSA
jgi:hypothetical protein